MNDFGQRVKNLRESLKLTQSELAEAVGYSDKTAISRIETGKLTCGCCESPMVGDSGTGRGKTYYYYTCTSKKDSKSCDLKSYPKEELEERICHVLEEVIRDDEFRNELINALSGALGEWREQNEETRPLTDGRLKEVKARIKNLTEAIATGSTSRALISELERAEEEAEMLEIEERRLELSIPEVIEAKEIEFFFLNLKEQSEQAADGARDMLLQTLLHHAVVYPDKLEIALNYTIDKKRAALIAKDGSNSSELVRISIALNLWQIRSNACQYRQDARQ